MDKINKIKLDKADRKILAELDKNCRISSTKLAKIVHKSRQSVDYRINRLIEEGVIIGFQASINPHKMGHKIYKIYLKLRNDPEEKENLFNYLRSSGIVYWMGEFSGRWDIIFAIFAKSDYEFFELKSELISKFGKIILEEYGDSLLDVKQYPKMYFTGEPSKPTMFAGEVVENKLDKLDYAILGEVVNNGRISLVDLAGKLKSTAIVLKKRMKKMEKNEIIIQYRLAINLEKLGLEMYKSIIRFDSYTKEEEKKLLSYISGIKGINYYIRNLWQTEPEIVVENYQQYYKIIEELKKKFPNIIRSVDALLMITDEWTPGFKNLLKAEK